MTATVASRPAAPVRAPDLAYAAAVVFLAATWPLLEFVAANRGEVVSVSRILVLAGVTVALALVVTVLAGRHRSDGVRRASVVAAWVLVAFFHFDTFLDPEAGMAWRVSDNVRPLVQLVVWTVLVVAVAKLVWMIAARASVRAFVLIFLGVVWLVPALDVASGGPGGSGGGDERAQGTDPVSALPEVGAKSDAPPLPARPNIYHFILDQYPRADAAQEFMDFDNQPFLDEMAERGFWVGEDSYSAYMSTVMSLPALLDASYPVTDTMDMRVGSARLGEPILGTASAIRALKAAGYHYLYADAGHSYWGSCRGDHVDVCLTDRPAGLVRTEADAALLERTPLSMLLRPDVVRASPRDVLTALDQRRGAYAEPFLLFAHLLTPHEPYRYTTDCTRRAEPSFNRNAVDYANEVRCLNEEMLEVVDEIQARDPTAVILIQSDHGTRFNLPWGSHVDGWSTESLRQRFGVLDLRLGPEGCELPPDGPQITVNTYPWLLACLAGTEPDYLDPRAFLWSYEYDGWVEEIDDPYAAFGEP